MSATPRIDAVRAWQAAGMVGEIDWPPDPPEEPPRPVPFIAPRIAPPPERLKLVTRPDGRIRRARAKLTKALIHAGVIARPARKHPTPPASEERTA